jgi:hypothetical protein
MLAAPIVCSGCKGGPKQSKTLSKELSGSLLRNIPSDSFGFFKWDGSSAAYKRLLKSPWAGSGDVSSLIAQRKGAYADLLKSFLGLGIYKSHEEYITQMGSEAVFFVSPNNSAAKSVSQNDNYVSGLVFKPKNKSAKEIIDVFKKSLGEQQIETSSLAGPNIKDGFTFSVEDNGKKQSFFVAEKNGLGVIAQSKEAVLGVIDKSTESLPAIVSDPQFSKLTSNVTRTEDIFGFGYVDLKNFKSSKKSSAAFAGKEITALSFAFGMEKTPVSRINVKWDSDMSSSWGLRGTTADSRELLNVVADKPIFYLEFDGVVLEKIIEGAGKGNKQLPQDFAQLLAQINIPAKVGVALHFHGTQTSFLPLPEFLLVAKTSKARELAPQLEKAISRLLDGNPMMAGQDWKTKELAENVSTKFLQSPIGLSLYLAHRQELVFLSSSLDFIKSQLSADPKNEKPFQLGKRSEESFTQGVGLGNMYLDFLEVGVLLEKVGGTLTMFAPQNQPAQSVLDPKNIADLKKLGVLVAEFRLNKDVTSINTYYEN